MAVTRCWPSSKPPAQKVRAAAPACRRGGPSPPEDWTPALGRSTFACRPRPTLPTEALSPLFQAALEATEEAVLNSLFKAETTTGNGRTVQAIDIDKVRELLKKHGR